MSTVYVFGGWLHNGGALMAFEAGACLAQKLGAPLKVIKVGEKEHPSPNFSYSLEASLISIQDFLSIHTHDDVLFLNPSFQKHLYSLSIKARIVSYIQHYTTFPYLDLGITHFVANSRFVQRFIDAVYGIKAPLIQPFLPEIDSPQAKPFHEKTHSALLSPKGHNEGITALKTYLEEQDVSFPITHAGFKQRTAFLNQINDHRFLLSLVINEGFGLIPLEAMFLGTIPVGLDGYGGQDYLEFGHNSLCVSQENIKTLPDILHTLDRYDLESLSKNATITAVRFTRAHFQQQWSDYFEQSNLI